MSVTAEAGRKEIVDARLALADARVGLAQAQRDLAYAGNPSSGPLADAAEAQWIRVALLERREKDALAALARGQRRRGGWRHALGLSSPGATRGAAGGRTDDGASGRTDTPSIREATLRFLDDQTSARHGDEDLHPSTLDPVQTDFDDALARAALAQKNADREARDA